MKLDFEFQTKYGVFRDALHLPDDHNHTQAEIMQMQQQRLDAWLAVIETPPEEQPVEEIVQPTLEINGETYRQLTGAPSSGAKLLEVNGVWYEKV